MYIKELSTFPAQRARRDGGEQDPVPRISRQQTPAPRMLPEHGQAHPCWGGSDRRGCLAWHRGRTGHSCWEHPSRQPKLLPAPPWRQSHLNPSPCRAGSSLHLKARQPSSHTHHPYNLPPPIPAPQQHPKSPGEQSKGGQTDLGGCVPSTVGRNGDRERMPGTAQRSPSTQELFQPAGERDCSGGSSSANSRDRAWSRNNPGVGIIQEQE